MRSQNKILIIGAQGMLGTDLVKIFQTDNNYQVIKADVGNIDITKKDQVDNFISSIKPDYVINAAAYTDVDKCEEEKEICNQVNGYSLENIAKTCKQNNSILIHISTDYIFDGNKSEGYKEDDVIDPVNQYGKSKAIGEQMVIKNSDDYYIIRISWLFGKSGKNFVETMLGLAKDRSELKVVNDQHGKPTYTVDLAKGIKNLIESETDYGSYHLPNEGETTWYDFAKEIFNIAGIDMKVIPCASEEFPRPAVRPNYSSLINTKLPKMRSWQGALKEYLDK